MTVGIEIKNTFSTLILDIHKKMIITINSQIDNHAKMIITSKYTTYLICYGQ